MRNTIKALLTALLALPLFTACDIHEWPDPLETVPVHIKLNYNAESELVKWTEWLHTFDDKNVTEQGMGKNYNNFLENGLMRYVVRVYPQSEKRSATPVHIKEFIFTRDISDDYECDLTLDVVPGKYNIMVWSDFINDGNDTYHDCENFSEITLDIGHEGNTDYRDAFRGVTEMNISSDYVSSSASEQRVEMQRPLAKFEFITNDLELFIENEVTRIAAKSNSIKDNAQDIPETRVNINDYKVVFYYVGFMPTAYNMHTDKPVDSSTGVFFESTLKKLNSNEASIGFDYVFVNGTESAVTVQVGIYDNEETLLSLTTPIKIPLRRSHHTILTGKFLTSEASGGLSINPDFDGEFNLIIP